MHQYHITIQLVGKSESFRLAIDVTPESKYSINALPYEAVTVISEFIDYCEESNPKPEPEPTQKNETAD